MFGQITLQVKLECLVIVLNGRSLFHKTCEIASRFLFVSVTALIKNSRIRLIGIFKGAFVEAESNNNPIYRILTYKDVFDYIIKMLNFL